jgi:DNA-directed RNA polymerase subunit H
MAKFKVENHSLVPKHSKLSEKETKALLERYNITLSQLPKILNKDPSIKNLNVKSRDVIKIVRKSPTAGESIFYRCVVNG